MADPEPTEAAMKAGIERIRLVDESKVEITFLIDELVKQVDVGRIRPIPSCNGCDSCN
jgi:hypothetical protein